MDKVTLLSWDVDPYGGPKAVNQCNSCFDTFIMFCPNPVINRSFGKGLTPGLPRKDRCFDLMISFQ